MTQTSGFSYTRDAQEVVWLAVDVPNAKVNTLKAEAFDDVAEILQQLEVNPPQAVILYSLKTDHFIAGADVAMIDACESAEQVKDIAKRGQQVFQRLANLPCPVVAAIHGACLGGGLELALACDYRVCSDAKVTNFAFPEVRLGLLPGAGGTQRLPRLIGVLPALDLIMTGKTISVKKAHKLGLVDEVVSEHQLLKVVKDSVLTKHIRKRTLDSWQCQLWNKSRWIDCLMVKSDFVAKQVIAKVRTKMLTKTAGHYPAPKAILEVFYHGIQSGFSTGLEQESDQFGCLAMTPESQALRRLFHQTTALKREQNSDAVNSITQVMVLGGGLMGAGIGYVSMTAAEANVRIKDIQHSGVLAALRHCHDTLANKVVMQKMTPREQNTYMQRLSGSVDWQGVQQCQLIIEAVFEELSIKQNMVKEVESQADQSVIFASNTSSIPISQIAEGAERPENIIGLHYFSPVEKMPLVEIVPHQGTSSQTIERVVMFARQQGKTPIVVKDSAGFYVNRILAPFLREALVMLENGEPITDIDQALTAFGFPMGPFKLLDAVGIDVCNKVMPVMIKELGERFVGPNILQTMIDKQWLGKKSRLGFYDYQGKGKVVVNEKLYAQLHVTPENYLTAETIAMRCLLPMLNEAARCWDEAVIINERDGDIGAIFGLGFPPFLGGPFDYMQHFGKDSLLELMHSYAQKYGEHYLPSEGLQRWFVSQDNNKNDG
ncbi:fatty acid oxidation complex subunit alpha FadJ [Vibrio palustris]|uniref:enoyl-CoA hydratase n=1 Tax=Vibrio palustris TaxID=1918946 RepID=A0A1R4B1L9_9VIBR|nr:fatty acid oxidation complex subunit alpha FadJ [Vibrio palustris]SJL82777.1 Fatty acid oxidation complex subunit alpha [Vibrio palustris]